MPLTVSNKETFFFSFQCNEFSKLRLNFGRHFAIPLILKQEHFETHSETFWRVAAKVACFLGLGEDRQRDSGNCGLEFLAGEVGSGEGARGNSIQQV